MFKFRMRFFYGRPMTKRMWIIVAAVTALITVVGIGAVLLSGTHIEDTNGSINTNLAVLTMDDILSDGHSSTTFASSTTCSGTNTKVSGNLRKYDYDQITFRAKKTSGIQVLHATRIDSDSITLHVDARVAAGNLEVVILVDGAYHSHVTLGSQQIIRLDGIAGKTVVVKMAAESAQVKISVSRTIS